MERLSEEEKKQRRRESNRRYKERNKEKIKAYSKIYNKKRYSMLTDEDKKKRNEIELERYHNNKDKILERRKELYQENKETILNRNKEWRENNKEQIKEWRRCNREHLSEYSKAYLKTPIGRACNLRNSYMHNDKKHNRGECTLTAQWIVENILFKPCHYCGETGWEIIGCDRIDNSKPHTPDNVVPCCKHCNSKKGSTSYDEYLKMLEEA